MRKIIALTFISLDGVMQAPGGPEEDTEGGFEYGGWLASYGDEALNEVLIKEMQPAALLLGRKTFDIFESYWPHHANDWPGINEVTKYALSTTKTTSEWQNTVFVNSVADIEKLKQSDGADLQIWGSSKLVQTLLAHDLVDEISLKIFPVILGKGKRLFDENAMPAAFTLTESTVTPKGVLTAKYKRAGDIVTGNVG